MTSDGRTIPTNLLSSINDALAEDNSAYKQGYFIVKNIEESSGSDMRVDFELLALQLTDDEYFEYLSYNNTDDLKCCWKDTGSEN